MNRVGRFRQSFGCYPGDCRHEHRQDLVRPVDGCPTRDDLHTPGQSLGGRPLPHVADRCRTIPRHGLCPADVPRESARHRGLPVRAVSQALPPGGPAGDHAIHAGRCQRAARLADLRRVGAAPDCTGPNARPRREPGGSHWRTPPTPGTRRPSPGAGRYFRGHSFARPRRRSRCTRCSICAAAFPASSTSRPASGTTSMCSTS